MSSYGYDNIVFMGTRNKERRRAKKKDRVNLRAQQRLRPDRTGRWWPGPSGPGGDLAAMVDLLIMDAAHAPCSGRDPKSLVAQLADQSAGEDWCSLVNARVTTALIDPVTCLLDMGWEPQDVCAILRRKVSTAAAGLGAGAIDAGLSGRPPGPRRTERWHAQLRELRSFARSLAVGSSNWEADVGSAIAAIGFLGHLHPLPKLNRPSERRVTRPDLDPSFLDKVRALLAKAQASTFQDEADAFLSKAQELMARHNLDRAILEQEGHSGVVEVEVRRIWLEDPYLKQKGFLLAVIADANRCRTVSVYDYGFVTVFGHPDDLNALDLLFTALLVHASKQMTLAVGTARPSYRRSFLLAYASRVGERLRDAAAGAAAAAMASAGDALLPVLARREREVDQALSQMFPETTNSTFSITDRAGWAAGRAAADLAELSRQPKLTDTVA